MRCRSSSIRPACSRSPSDRCRSVATHREVWHAQAARRQQVHAGGANAGGLAIPADYQGVREQFAVSQFTELSDSEKLSRRSFEPLPSGFSLTGTSNLQATLPVTREVIYELSYLRRKPIRIEFSGLVRLAVKAYDRLVKGSAVRQSALAKQQTRPSLNAPPQVTLPGSVHRGERGGSKGYAGGAVGAVVFPHRSRGLPAPEGADSHANPALAGQIQVVSQFELKPKGTP